MKTNYKKLLDREIEYIKTLERKPTLLLHACCAPCSSAVLEELCEYFDITLFFYNPNISPREEFVFRLEELRRLVSEMGLDGTEVVAPDYDGGEFEAVAAGFEGLPEGGARCERCFRLRLERSVAFGAEKGFDYVTTTLSISPHKNAALLNEIGLELEKKYGVRYLCSDFKKGEGYKRSCQLSRDLGLYRQNYCGCIYSKRQAEAKN